MGGSMCKAWEVWRLESVGEMEVGEKMYNSFVIWVVEEEKGTHKKSCTCISLLYADINKMNKGTFILIQTNMSIEAIIIKQ